MRALTVKRQLAARDILSESGIVCDFNGYTGYITEKFQGNNVSCCYCLYIYCFVTLLPCYLKQYKQNKQTSKQATQALWGGY